MLQGSALTWGVCDFLRLFLAGPYLLTFRPWFLEVTGYGPAKIRDSIRKIDPGKEHFLGTHGSSLVSLNKMPHLSFVFYCLRHVI